MLGPWLGAARERKAWMEDIVNVMLLIVLGGGGLLVALIYAISTGSARSERLQRLEEEQGPSCGRALKDAAARIAWLEGGVGEAMRRSDYVRAEERAIEARVDRHTVALAEIPEHAAAEREAPAAATSEPQVAPRAALSDPAPAAETAPAVHPDAAPVPVAAGPLVATPAPPSPEATASATLSSEAPAAPSPAAPSPRSLRSAFSPKPPRRLPRKRPPQLPSKRPRPPSPEAPAGPLPAPRPGRAGRHPRPPQAPPLRRRGAASPGPTARTAPRRAAPGPLRLGALGGRAWSGRPRRLRAGDRRPLLLQVLDRQRPHLAGDARRPRRAGGARRRHRLGGPPPPRLHRAGQLAWPRAGDRHPLHGLLVLPPARARAHHGRVRADDPGHRGLRPPGRAERRHRHRPPRAPRRVLHARGPVHGRGSSLRPSSRLPARARRRPPLPGAAEELAVARHAEPARHRALPGRVDRRPHGPRAAGARHGHPRRLQRRVPVRGAGRGPRRGRSLGAHPRRRRAPAVRVRALLRPARGPGRAPLPARRHAVHRVRGRGVQRAPGVRSVAPRGHRHRRHHRDRRVARRTRRHRHRLGGGASSPRRWRRCSTPRSSSTCSAPATTPAPSSRWRRPSRAWGRSSAWSWWRPSPRPTTPGRGSSAGSCSPRSA